MQGRTRSIRALLCRQIASLALFVAVGLCALPSLAHAQMARPAIAADMPGGLRGSKTIIVSLSRQRLYAYQGRHLVFSTAVTTGRPGLRTPTGTYAIFAKYSPTTFYAPFSRSSANWYPPTHINYALEWKAGGYFLHDSWWHSTYGPGTTSWHRDPVYGWQQGSHGCISMRLGAAAWLYRWAAVGTAVRILS